MLQQIVGNVDAASAAVLVALFVCLAAVAVVGIRSGQRRGELALETLKAAAEAARAAYEAETRRLVELEEEP